MTASERAKEINARFADYCSAKGCPVTSKLADDAEHWAEYGITTGEQLDHYLAVEDHQDAFKSVNGFRPRHVDYDAMTAAQINEMTARLTRD